MSSAEARETAWRIHGAVSDWTGKVDVKAAFALTLESALLAGIVAVGGADHKFARLGGFTGFVLWVGIALVVVATGLAILTVTPRVRKRDVAGEAGENFIFFGHLQFWTPEGLESALESRDPLPMLSRQLVVMSEIAWKKHRWVKWSFRLAACGGFLVFLVFAAS